MSVLVDPSMEELVAGAPQALRVSVEGLSSLGARFPVEHTCEGLDRAPRVIVGGLPAGTRAVALIMYDPDAPIGTFIHWLAVQPAERADTIFPSPSALEGRNDFGRTGYGGPCPPRGHGVHRYYFLVLALGDVPRLRRGFSLRDLLRAARGRVLAWSYWMGTYSR